MTKKGVNKLKDKRINLRVNNKMYYDIMKQSKELKIPFSELIRLYIQAGINSYGKTE